MTDTKLLPCPFCDGEAFYRPDHTTENVHTVCCVHCDYWISDRCSTADCIEHWNTRPTPSIDTETSFQDKVCQWVVAAFGETVAADTTERNHRFLEEALELVQALGCTRTDAMSLVDYVYNRPVGEANQEVGGVLMTLMALCGANNINSTAEGEKELKRVYEKIEVIRAKQAGKPKNSPLPQHVQGVDIDDAVKVETVAKIIYEAMEWACANNAGDLAPKWVEGGNSHAQTEARLKSASIIQSAGYLGAKQRAKEPKFFKDRRPVMSEPKRIWSTGLTNGAVGDAWVNASDERVNDNQVEYIRADLHEALQARVKELEAAIDTSLPDGMSLEDLLYRLNNKVGGTFGGNEAMNDAYDFINELATLLSTPPQEGE